MRIQLAALLCALFMGRAALAYPQAGTAQYCGIRIYATELKDLRYNGPSFMELAGTSFDNASPQSEWIPAFAGAKSVYEVQRGGQQLLLGTLSFSNPVNAGASLSGAFTITTQFVRVGTRSDTDRTSGTLKLNVLAGEALAGSIVTHIPGGASGAAFTLSSEWVDCPSPPVPARPVVVPKPDRANEIAESQPSAAESAEQNSRLSTVEERVGANGNQQEPDGSLKVAVVAGLFVVVAALLSLIPFAVRRRSTREADRKQLRRLIEDLPYSPAIQFMKDHDFGNSFFRSALSPFDAFSQTWSSPERAFHDKSIQRGLVALCKAVDKFHEVSLPALFIVDGSAASGDSRLEIPRHWASAEINKFKQTRDALNARGNEIERAYSDLVALARRRLKC